MRKMLIFLCLFLICFSSTAYPLCEWAVYVDTDAAGANDGGRDYVPDPNDPTQATNWTDAYTTLSAAIAGQAQDLTSTDKWLHFYLRASSGTDDTTTLTITGYTTDATRYILIEGYDFPTDGIWDGTKYLLHNNDSAIFGLTISEDCTRITKLQLLVTETSTNDRNGIGVLTIGAANDIRIDKCIIKGACSGTGNAYGIFINSANANVRVTNSVIHSFISGADTAFRGIHENTGNSILIYNNTIRNCYYGIVRTASTMSSTNNALFDNVNDHVGTITILTCATDEGAGEPGGAGVNISTNWNTTCFTDQANHDYHVQDVDSPLYGTGTDLSGTFTDDIVGVARSSWDIGAYEFVGAGGGIVPILYNLENQ